MDPQTGILCNIHKLDAAVHAGLAADGRTCWSTAREACQALWQHLQQQEEWAASLTRLELATSPYLRYGIKSSSQPMMTITQQFEFSAAHRLHSARLTDAENRAVFGKCNNPHGHGHNYVVEVTIGGNGDGAEESLLPLARLNDIVRARVIEKLDHRHLNLEVDEFRNSNPTVECIASVIWRWLDGQLKPAKLQKVRVYETPKTWADVTVQDNLT